MSLLDEARNAPVWGERVKDMKTHVPISPEARDALVELADAAQAVETEHVVGLPASLGSAARLRAALERLQR